MCVVVLLNRFSLSASEEFHLPLSIAKGQGMASLVYNHLEKPLYLNYLYFCFWQLR